MNEELELTEKKHSPSLCEILYGKPELTEEEHYQYFLLTLYERLKENEEMFIYYKYNQLDRNFQRIIKGWKQEILKVLLSMGVWIKFEDR
jgi:hypothetical protein